MLPRHVSPSGVVIRRAKQYSQARVGTNLERVFHSYDEFIMYTEKGIIEKFINWRKTHTNTSSDESSECLQRILYVKFLAKSSTTIDASSNMIHINCCFFIHYKQISLFAVFLPQRLSTKY
mmetsp:Transcript_1063/g.1327  ORF Transcript_1063/g.1327 Transcript_1063/m.1327 type:complete len:121 (+) Transcript_1063:150-512(+)